MFDWTPQTYAETSWQTTEMWFRLADIEQAERERREQLERQRRGRGRR